MVSSSDDEKLVIHPPRRNRPDAESEVDDADERAEDQEDADCFCGSCIYDADSGSVIDPVGLIDPQRKCEF